MNRPWVTQTLIECYQANRDPVPGHLLAEQQEHEKKIRRACTRYETERQDDHLNPNDRN